LETEAINLDGKTVNISIAEVLESDDYSLKDKTEAYQEMIQNLQSMGDEYAEVVAAFKEEYQGLEKFAEYKKQYGSELLDFIEDAGLSNDDINALYGA
jgi:hypothetical protein